MIHPIRGLYPTYRNNSHISTSKRKNLDEKWAENLKRYFYKKDIQMVNRQMKRCSTSPITREMQIKTTMRHHLTPVGGSYYQKRKSVNIGEDMEKKGNFMHCW